MYKNFIKSIIKNNISFLKHTINKHSDLNNKYVVLLYHRILDEHINDPVDNFILTENFYDQIKFLTKSYDVVSFNDINSINNNKKIKVIISFDDGYKDNYLNAFPILKEFNINAIFFILANYTNKKKLIWDRELCLLFNYMIKNKKLYLLNDILETNNLLKNIWDYISIFKKINFSKIENIIYTLKNELKYISSYSKYDYPMSWEELSLMNKKGMIIGSHGLNHMSLSNLSKDDLLNELLNSKKIIESNLKIECKNIAFPFGNKLDFNHDVIKYSIKSGYKNCFLNTHNYNYYNNQFSLDRIVVHKNKNLNYILG